MFNRLWTLSLGLLLLAGNAQAENWPYWRGPEYNGICHETGIVTEWSQTKNVAWRLPLPGPAGSTPVVWGDRLFLTTVDATSDGDQKLDDQKLDLMCISTQGKVLWRRTLGLGNQNVGSGEGNFASASPVTDGQFVAALIGNGRLACYDLEGTLQWKTDLDDRYGPIDIQFGYTSSPLLNQGRLYIQLIHGDGDPETHEARIVCLDIKSGEEIWSRPRLTEARAECEHAYTSPILYRDDRREFLLTHGADTIIAHALEDGRELWRCGGFNLEANYNETLRLVASPSVSPGLIVVPTAKNGPVLGLSPDGTGDITDSDTVLWRLAKDTPDVPSPIIHEGLVYLCRENGNLICLDAKSGEEIYKKRTVRNRHRASPLLVDGNLYLTARNGTVTVVPTGRKFRILAQNKMEETISASPIVANGTLYLRSYKALYAIREEVQE